MAAMLTKLYEALIEALTGQKKAAPAADQATGYEAHFAKLERDFKVLQWMVGFTIALNLTMIGKLLMACR